MRRNAPATSRSGEPVADRGAALIQANVLQRGAAEHRGQVARFDQREFELLTTHAGRFLLGEIAARVSLGVRSGSPGEPLQHRVTERQQLGRHVGLVPGTQQHHVVGQRRHWKPKLSHGEMISLGAVGVGQIQARPEARRGLGYSARRTALVAGL